LPSDPAERYSRAPEGVVSCAWAKTPAPVDRNAGQFRKIIGSNDLAKLVVAVDLAARGARVHTAVM